MKQKCYKCRFGIADRTINNVVFICNDCCDRLLAGAVIADFHNYQTRGMRKKKNLSTVK